MKRFLYYAVASLIIYSGCTPAVVIHNTPPLQQEDEVAPEPVTFQKFYDELSPYGRWIDYPAEGYVWSPNVDPTFKPYASNGHWVYSDEGWTWVSDFNWGWGPFHYGNWFYEAGYGWLWLPGTQWAPAWVTWGQSGSYYGWAPVPPHVNVSQGWTPPQEAWNFVPQEHIVQPNLSNYIVNKTTNVTIVKNVTIINNVRNNKTTIINNTTTNNTTNNHVTNNNVTNNTTTNVTNNNTVVNNNNHTVVNNTNVNNLKSAHGTTIVNRGPQVTEVAKVVPVTPVKINEYDKPVKSTVTPTNKLIMYRPVIKKPEPKKVETYTPAAKPR